MHPYVFDDLYSKKEAWAHEAMKKCCKVGLRKIIICKLDSQPISSQKEMTSAQTRADCYYHCPGKTKLSPSYKEVVVDNMVETIKILKGVLRYLPERLKHLDKINSFQPAGTNWVFHRYLHQFQMAPRAQSRTKRSEGEKHEKSKISEETA